MNRVISPYSAIVDGTRTGLAGCTNSCCKKPCLRKHESLACRHGFKADANGTCITFIEGGGDAEV